MRPDPQFYSISSLWRSVTSTQFNVPHATVSAVRVNDKDNMLSVHLNALFYVKIESSSKHNVFAKTLSR